MITASQLQPIAGGAISSLQSLDALCMLRGTNLSGAEFGIIPGRSGYDYTFPTLQELAYFVGKGMKIIRMPFLWERIQPALGGPLDPAHVAWLTSFVQYDPNVSFLLDVHNFGTYLGNPIGMTGGPTDAQFANLWSQLATLFKGNPNVIFGLMNEPHLQPTATWLGSANAAIAAIRTGGAPNLITVSGTYWDSAAAWNGPGDSSSVMLGVVDPGNNCVFEVHQYFDADGSGESSTAVSSTVGSQRITRVTQWARFHGKRLLLGEFGAADNTTMLAALTDCVAYMKANADVWMGWTYWSAGPWWGPYNYSIEPSNLGQASQAEAAQMTALLPYL